MKDEIGAVEYFGICPKCAKAMKSENRELEKVKAMVNTLLENGYGISEIQELMSKSYYLEVKNGDIEITELDDFPF